MTARRLLAFFLVFVGGFGFANVTKTEAKRERPNQIDFGKPVRVYRCDNPGLDSMQLEPYRVTIDGEGQTIGETPKGSQPVWRIDFDSARVVIFATSKPIP